MKKVNFRFKIPWGEICPKCRAILEQRKKEQRRVNSREWMRTRTKKS